MEREFLDVLDYDLSVSEADLLDLHETFVLTHPSKPAPQLHPFFQFSVLERGSRPQGIDMFRTRRVSDEQHQDHTSVSSTSVYEDEAPLAPPTPSSPRLDHTISETHVGTTPSDHPSPQTPTSSDSSSEPSASATATSAFSFQPEMVSKKPFTGQDGAQKSAISRALWLAGHQLISTIPTTAFPQLAVAS